MSDEILRKLAELDKQFEKVNDEAQAEIKKHGDVLATTQEKLDSIELAIKKGEEDNQKRLDDIEEKLNTPVRESGNLSKAEIHHLDAFDAWMRDPRNHEKASALIVAAKEADPRLKAVDTSSGSSGGYAVPEIICRKVHEKVQDISPVRDLITFIPIGSSDYKELVDVNGEEFGWAGEGDTRNETGTGGLEEVAPTMGTLYAYPKATEESLDDIYFNVSDWLIRKVSKAFARGEGVGFISGDGSNKMTGILAGTPVSTNDEELVGSPAAGRAFGVLQYIPTGAAGNLNHSPLASPPTYGGDPLIDLEMSLKPEYRANAKYMMNKSTLGQVRKWKDVDGNYVWQRSMVLGQPSTINNYEVRELEAMPDVAANAFPIAFGDYMEGYLGVNRIGLRMTVDNITTPGYVKYYVRRRIGGKIMNDDAIKVLKAAAS